VGGAASGRKIDMRVVETIEKGKTTRWQLADQLGTPTTVTLAPDGKRIVSYIYSESRAAGVFSVNVKTQQQILQIICDQDGIVTDFLFTDLPMETKTIR
jgi:outer membrane protein assembly factor BamE (lipoprotein component of BamABCDE complex)